MRNRARVASTPLHTESGKHARALETCPLAVDTSRTSPIEKLVDEGQTVRAVAQAGDNERLDIDYIIDGEAWWQRKYVLAWGEGKALVLTAQARTTTEEATTAAIDAIERSITPYYTA